jgi:hypothetical protein
VSEKTKVVRLRKRTDPQWYAFAEDRGTLATHARRSHSGHRGSLGSRGRGKGARGVKGAVGFQPRSVGRPSDARVP